MKQIQVDINEFLTSLGACQEAVVWANEWAASDSPLTIWQSCNRSSWMLWLLERTTLDENDPRYRLMACDFAEAVLHLVPKGEDRPRKAIEVARKFVAGEATREEMAAAGAAWAAWAAGAAGAAARAAGAAQCEIIRSYFPECPKIDPKYLKVKK